MFKLTTQLAFFRFNSTVNQGNFTITWFVLDREDEEEGGRCFTQEELTKFTDYTVKKLNNFPGGKNYSNCSEEDTPYCGLYSMLEDSNLNYPTKFILRQNPKMHSKVADCVDIVLTSTNSDDQHDYDLTFDVIGQIET